MTQKPILTFFFFLLFFCGLFILIYPVSAQTTATITITGVIKEHPLVNPPIARFSVFPSIGKSPLRVTNRDKSLYNPTGYLWSFGDGTRSGQKNPLTHEYDRPGFYRIQLTVWNSAGRDTTTAFVYVMPKGWWWYNYWRR